MTDNLLREPPVLSPVELSSPRILPLSEWTKALRRLRHTRARPGPCVAVIRMVPSLRGGPMQTFGAPPPGLSAVVATGLDQYEFLTVAGDDLLLLLRGDAPHRIRRRLTALVAQVGESYDARPPQATPACGYVRVSTRRGAP